MADVYIDISAPGNEYQAYAATPTWGALSTDKPLPMDGNGKAGPGHSAAVAIAEIQITVLPGDTNTLVIAGCTLTAKTTAAAKNQWTISGAISTCITNLRDLINTFGTSTAQCDAATPTTVSQLQLALPYWCFARVKPGTTDTLQIATRFAGSDMNQATNSNVGITSSGWATPPTITQFAGGADGPWAYQLNTTTIFGKSDGQTGTAGPGYGLFFAASPTPFEPSVTADSIHVRTKRGGSNLSVTWNSTGTASAAWKQRNYVFDDGTVWSGDNGKLTVTFKNSNGSSTGSIFTVATSGTLSFASRSNGNFEIQCGVTTSGSGSFTLFSLGAAAKLAFKRSRFVETSDNIRYVSLVTDGGASVASWYVDLSDSFAQLRTSVTSKPLVSASGSSTGVRMVLNGMTFEVVAANANIGKFISMTGAGQSGTVEWIGGEVRDSLGVYRCPMPYDINAGNSIDSIIDGVVGITNPSVGMTASATVNARFRWNSPEGPNKGFRSETPRYAVDWQGDGTFPYCGAAADLRGVNWSHRFTWTSIPSAWAPVTILKLSRFYRGTSAAKTIGLELYLPTATTVYLDEIEMTVSYLDSTDVWRTESVGGARGLQFSSSRTALSSSSATWTANGVASYGAKKVELTTAYSIKSGSEIIARVSLCASRGSTLTGYASPELSVT